MSKLNGQVSISNTQLWAMLASSIWPTVIGYGGGYMARQAGRDMWVSAIIAVLTTLVVGLSLVYVVRKFPGASIIHSGQSMIGKFTAKFLGLVLAVHFLIGADQSVSIYVHHINDFLLTETPFILITTIHVLVVCYLVWHGPEVIARLGVIAFLSAAFFTILVFLAALQELNVERMLPMFDAGIPSIAKASLTADSFIGINTLAIVMFLPLAGNKAKVGRSMLIGICLGGGLFIFYLVAELWVMGHHVIAQMRIPCMDLVRSIELTKYLHRFESFMLALWYWSMLVQAGILTYGSAVAVQHTLGLPKLSKFIVIALGIALTTLTYMTALNRIVFLNFIEHGWQWLNIPIDYGLPLLLFLTALFKKRGQTGSEKE